MLGVSLIVCLCFGSQSQVINHVHANDVFAWASCDDWSCTIFICQWPGEREHPSSATAPETSASDGQRSSPGWKSWLPTRQSCSWDRATRESDHVCNEHCRFGKGTIFFCCQSRMDNPQILCTIALKQKHTFTRKVRTCVPFFFFLLFACA